MVIDVNILKKDSKWECGRCGYDQELIQFETENYKTRGCYDCVEAIIREYS